MAEAPMPINRLEHQFVEQVPTDPAPGVLYVSMIFRTTMHLCACGCANETWVPIRPRRHHLRFDGEAITLDGSIGNWDFPCRSHYWIRCGRIVWADDLPQQPPWWRRVLERFRPRRR